MAKISKFFQTSVLVLIRFYQLAISGLLGHCCRFEPSCSHYTMEAIKLHGMFIGLKLGLMRICRCHPWQPGGYDPVPSCLKCRSSTHVQC